MGLSAAECRIVAGRLRRAAYFERRAEGRTILLAEAARFSRVARTVGIVERATAPA